MKKRAFSADVNKAQKRLDGIRSISNPIDLGNGYTDVAYEAQIKVITSMLEQYNTLLSQVDGMATSLDKAEQALGHYSKCVLSQVGAKYGFDSIEYEKAGGTRTSAIQRSTSKMAKSA